MSDFTNTLIVRLYHGWHLTDDVDLRDAMKDAEAELKRLITVCESYALSSAAACRDIKRLHARCEELENSLRFLGKAAFMMATEGEIPHPAGEQSPSESAS